MNKKIISFIKSVIPENIYSGSKLLLYKIKWLLNKPKYPKTKDDKILIHLGCGKIFHKDFINVDLKFYPHIHHFSDIQNLNMFDNNFADLIYISHCLEHIPHTKILATLKEYFRVLKPAGVLRISVPNFDAIVQIYNETNNKLEIIQGPLMGGHDSELNIHKAIFNYNFLKTQLEKAGFSTIQKWDYGTGEYMSFDDWSGKCLETEEKNYVISLNVEAVK
jgi:predicted SAM-dependent methyltransferase